MNHKKLGTTLLALTLALTSFGSQAGVIYQWVCDDSTCNGDPTFTSTMEISDSAFAAGSFTGVTGNILSWDTTSGVGNGFMLDLSDIVKGDPIVFRDDFNTVMIVLTADGSQIQDLFDDSQGLVIAFENSTVGNVAWRETGNVSYFVTTRTDFGPCCVDDFNPIAGIFVRVPEPSTLGLLGAGLLALFMRRKRVA